MNEVKFSAKALMLCPICKNSYYSKLEVTVPDNLRDMKQINIARDNNGDIVHLDICSSAAPIKKEPCHICGVNDEINELAKVLWKITGVGSFSAYCHEYWLPMAKKIYEIGYRLPNANQQVT